MSTPILSSIAILCGGCVDIPLSYMPLKRTLMTKEELNKWNLRFCPKCRGHIQISFKRKKEGGIEIIKHCQNFGKCDYRSVLSKENISNNDRHKIIETFFGYNKPFSIDSLELKSLTKEKLMFDNNEDFLKWFVFETSKYKALDHNNLPVSSPYWTIVKKLGKFLSDNYENELKQIIQNKANIDNEQFLKTNSGLSFNILYA